MIRLVRLSVLGSIVSVLLSGCAYFGDTKVQVAHSPLVSASQKRQGTVLVRHFVDARQEERRYIGVNRHGILGIPYGQIAIKGDATLQSLLTDYFVEALTETGYNAIREASVSAGRTSTALDVDAVLEGTIQKFWLDSYMNGWQEVSILLRLRDRDGQHTFWEKEILSVEVNALWMGTAGEYEHLIHQALDKALARAVAEFASDDFYQGVQKARSR